VIREEVKLVLPFPHPGQLRAYELLRYNRFVVGRCGRRWGKTDFGAMVACKGAWNGELVGWFAPDYKRLSEAYEQIVHVLKPIILRSNKMEGIIRTEGGGQIEFWTLLDEQAGRSRKYHTVIIDEAAFTKPNMMAIWERSIEPTLLDYTGKCLVISNTNGVSEDNFLYQICEPDDKRPLGTPGKNFDFVEFHAPSKENPHVPKRKPGETDAMWRIRQEAEFERIRARCHPLVFQQEYLADFIDFSGISFFSKDKLLVNGEPVPYPNGCETVFAVIDTAVKEGQEHDGTAVSFWAKMPEWFHTYQLVCLDWDIISIDGALLETWIPGVYDRLEELSRDCRAMHGSIGVYIEDAQSGSILLQQCDLRGWPAAALPADLTSAGKDARAINASSPVYRGDVKFSAYAWEKTTIYRDISRNHMLSQISSFRVGDKLAAKRADDLLDTFTYAVAISCGGSEGIA
jgi:hypothetical protein